MHKKKSKKRMANEHVSKMDRNSQMPTFNTGSKKDNSNSERDISDGLVRLNRTDDDDEIFSSPGY